MLRREGGWSQKDVCSVSAHHKELLENLVAPSTESNVSLGAVRSHNVHKTARCDGSYSQLLTLSNGKFIVTGRVLSQVGRCSNQNRVAEAFANVDNCA